MAIEDHPELKAEIDGHSAFPSRAWDSQATHFALERRRSGPRYVMVLGIVGAPDEHNQQGFVPRDYGMTFAVFEDQVRNYLSSQGLTEGRPTQ